MTLSIRLPDSMGCTVASTAVLTSLREEYGRVIAVTPFPFLLRGLRELDIATLEEHKWDCDVDLRTYTARRPHNSLPHRPSYVHMTEMAQEQLGIRLAINKPFIPLSEKENSFGRNEVSHYQKPLIWIQSLSTSFNRLWPEENWIALKENISDQYDFIDLSCAHYSPRESLAIARNSFSGVCLDSYMVHGSAAVGTKNVLVILGSSRPECVTYPGQYVFYRISSCRLQPCGMHGYFNGCKQEHECMFNNTQCIHKEPLCMKTISVQTIAKTLRSLK